MGPALDRNIFARNCKVRRIDKDTAASFLQANHRFGSASCRYCYGMFVERTTGSSETATPAGTLVAVSQFSNARRMRDGSRSYEWIRYASLSDMRVVGGMGKMLDCFVAEIHPDDVMSYAADCDGDAYRTLGFSEEGFRDFPGGHRSYKFRRRFSI